MKRFLFFVIALFVAFAAFAQKMPANDSVSRAKSYARYERFMRSDTWPVPDSLADGQSVAYLMLTVDSLLRKAIVIYPESAKRGEPAPVVFVFHGRRGLLPQVMRTMNIYRYYPEAIVVYPQGLWLETPKAKKMQWGTGWKMPRRKEDWRDVHLFDALLDTLGKTFSVDSRKIYSMGHSNGGGMTYGLWSVRGDKLAAVSISCASSRISGQLPDLRQPKPVFFVIATQDQLVDYDDYTNYINFILEKQTTGISQTIAPGKCFYPAKAGGADVFVDTIEEAHKVDKAAMPLIAAFFRNH